METVIYNTCGTFILCIATNYQKFKLTNKYKLICKINDSERLMAEMLFK
jgi:hypothetical protein